MKKIINGKMYNTETAKELESYWNGYSERDFNYCYEVLYVKKTGEYFLACEGGPMSPYAGHYGDMRGYGEEIIPMTEEEAKEWAEEKLTADEYVKVFGEPEE